MSNDNVKLDDKSLASAAGRLNKFSNAKTENIIKKALADKALNNEERNILIQEVFNDKFRVAKPMAMSQMKKEILMKCGHVVSHSIGSFSRYSSTTPNGSFSRAEMEIVYKFMVLGQKVEPKKSDDDEEEDDE